MQYSTQLGLCDQVMVSLFPYLEININSRSVPNFLAIECGFLIHICAQTTNLEFMNRSVHHIELEKVAI